MTGAGVSVKVLNKNEKGPLPEKWAIFEMAGWTGLEPATFCVTGRRSNQLSYHPVKRERGANVGWVGSESSAVFPLSATTSISLPAVREITGDSSEWRVVFPLSRPPLIHQRRCWSAVVAQLDRAAVF